jgi:hypothetical protein
VVLGLKLAWYRGPPVRYTQPYFGPGLSDWGHLLTLTEAIIEKIKAAIKKRAEAKAKRLFLKKPKRLAKR